MSERKYPWNLLDEMFGKVNGPNGMSIIEEWCYNNDCGSYPNNDEELARDIREKIVEIRLKKYMNEKLNDEERKVIDLRNSEWYDYQAERSYQQMPWNQIQERMEYNDYREGQVVYNRAVKKLKHPEMFQILSPKLSEEEKEYLASAVEDNWSKWWEGMFKIIKERFLPDFELNK